MAVDTLWTAIGALATVGATGVALFFGVGQARRERNKTAEERAAREAAEDALAAERSAQDLRRQRAQAERFCVWVEQLPADRPDELPRFEIIILNGSDLPIYEVMMPQAGLPFFPMIPPGTRLARTVEPSERTMEVVSSLPGAPVHVRFRDAEGNYWDRDDDGNLKMATP